MKMRRTWRIAGILCLMLCLMMVLMGGVVLRPGMNRMLLAGYWVVFVLLMMAALWIAMLDVRFTRLEYKIRERALFHEAFMTDRQALEDAKRQRSETGAKNGEA